MEKELLPVDLKDILAKGIGNEELKEKVEEYIETCKLKKQIAKEILELAGEQGQTKNYLDELSKELEAIKLTDTTKELKS